MGNPAPATRKPCTAGPRVTLAQARLQPGDLVLRHHRPYQRLRSLSLAASLVVILGVPLWHAAAHRRSAAGLAHAGRWAEMAAGLPLPSVPWIEGAPWSVSVGGLEFLDPLALISVAAAGGLRWAALLGAVPILLLMLLLGRFFCGWICPYVPLLAASNGLRSLLARAGWRPPNVTLPRRLGLAILGGLLIASAVARTPLAPLGYPPAIVGREVARAILQGGLGMGAGVLLLIFAFDTLVSRAGFCRSLCPGGALFSLLSRPSPVRVIRTPAKCTDCTACDVVCNLGQRPMSDRLDPGCERCGKCVAVCPTNALALTTLRRPRDRP
jgi:NapH/MauN family ferredoxin-type protein